MFAFRGRNAFHKGNAICLLKDGDQFFPRLLQRIDQAREEIFFETFILANDKTGTAFKEALVRAAKRGVWISVTVDSYGTYFLPDDYITELSRAGVIFQIYDPQPQWFFSRPKIFRRLHRKLVVIDNSYAYIGGINHCDDHLTGGNNTGKRDFTVEVRGPVVADIRQLCASYVRAASSKNTPRLSEYPDPESDSSLQTLQGAEIQFVSRDNRRNRSEIEKAYIARINAATKQVTLANAYFFPGFRVMRALRKATERGVRVRLVLQGNPDIPFALRAAKCLYETLTRHGIEIYEYTERPLHAKVATIDDNWASIGSSNLDPWSLALNLEANIFVRDKQFNAQLHHEIDLLTENSRRVELDVIKKRDWWTQLRNAFFYHFLRRLPAITAFIPNPRPQVQQIRRIYKTSTGESHNRKYRRDYPESSDAKHVVIEKKYKQLKDL